MSDNFQQTVNLKDRINNYRDAVSRVAPKNNPVETTRAEERKEFQKISRPITQKFKVNEKWIKIGLIAVAVILAIFIVRGLFFGKKKEVLVETPKWYAVKLINGEVFYGQVSVDDATRLTMKNVYYNYDQIKNGTTTDTVTGGSLRLVKLGKEAYGPEGTREILQDKVIYKDLLKQDSKVLKAILDYEK